MCIRDRSGDLNLVHKPFITNIQRWPILVKPHFWHKYISFFCALVVVTEWGLYSPQFFGCPKIHYAIWNLSERFKTWVNTKFSCINQLNIIEIFFFCKTNQTIVKPVVSVKATKALGFMAIIFLMSIVATLHYTPTPTCLFDSY